jgi:hypothetical protein
MLDAVERILQEGDVAQQGYADGRVSGDEFAQGFVGCLGIRAGPGLSSEPPDVVQDRGILQCLCLCRAEAKPLSQQHG